MRDEKIIELYWERDEEALRQINQKYGAFCYDIAHNILNNEEDARECVNDAWFKIWMITPPENPRFLQAFLGKITRSLSLQRYRQSRAAQKRGNAADAIDEIGKIDKINVIYEELDICAADSSADTRTDSSVIADAVSCFLTELPHGDRIIFVRRYWFADSVGQIALRYGMSERRVNSVLMQCRDKLKVYLKKEGITV